MTTESRVEGFCPTGGIIAGEARRVDAAPPRSIVAAWPRAVWRARSTDMRARAPSIVVLLLVLAAAVRALRFWMVMSWAHSDETNVAVPAVQILGGTFPIHHVGVEYVGATAAYPLAAWF